jgi:hypothetical protein
MITTSDIMIGIGLNAVSIQRCLMQSHVKSLQLHS